MRRKCTKFRKCGNKFKLKKLEYIYWISSQISEQQLEVSVYLINTVGKINEIILVIWNDRNPYFPKFYKFAYVVDICSVEIIIFEGCSSSEFGNEKNDRKKKGGNLCLFILYLFHQIR